MIGTYAERLEVVRQRHGFTDLMTLWRMLSDYGWPGSYDAARTYHYGDREPPVSYIVAVAQALNESVEWLATGEASNGALGGVADDDLLAEVARRMGRKP